MKHLFPTGLRCCIDRYPQTFEEVTASARQAVEENPVNAPLVLPGSAVHPFQMALLTNKKWRAGRILTVQFLDGAEADHEEVVRQAELWLPHVSIGFDWVGPGLEADIRVSFSQEGAWSYIGTDALTVPRGAPTMNYGFLQEGTAVHEFGHALGCIHEHQSPGAGVIPWIKSRVYAYYGGPPNNWSHAMVDQNIFGHYGEEQTQFTKWDRASIMEYPIDKQLVSDPAFAVAWNKELSAVDRQYIATVYPRLAPPPPPPPPPAKERLIVVSVPAGTFITVDGKPV